jgi:hypothetical protein
LRIEGSYTLFRQIAQRLAVTAYNSIPPKKYLQISKKAAGFSFRSNQPPFSQTNLF